MCTASGHSTLDPLFLIEVDFGRPAELLTTSSAVEGVTVGSWLGGGEERFGDEAGDDEDDPDARCSNLARIEDTELAGESSGSMLEGSELSDLARSGEMQA